MKSISNEKILLINDFLKENGDFLHIVEKKDGIFKIEFKPNILINTEYHPINLSNKLIEKINEIVGKKVIFSGCSFW